MEFEDGRGAGLAVAGAQAPADLLAAGYLMVAKAVDAWMGDYCDVGRGRGPFGSAQGGLRYGRPGGRRYRFAGRGGATRCGEGQGWREGVLKGAPRTELFGQASRSAFILVHAEGLRQAPG
jgi:hypothetical protein